MQVRFDKEWRKRLIHGDVNASLQLVDQVAEPLYRQCIGAVGDSSVAQEMVADVLELAVRQIDRYEPQHHDSNLLSWVATLGSLTFDDQSKITAGSECDQSLDSDFLIQLQTNVCLAARERQPEDSSRYRHRESKVPVACPSCRARWSVNRKRLGHDTRCGSCGESFPIRSAVESTINHVRPEGKRASTTAPQSAGPTPPPLPPIPIKQTPAVDAGSKLRSNDPRNVGRFAIREWIGSGSFADVYRAYDPVLEREVALKLATQSALGHKHVRKYVLAEPKAAARLRHPNIVAVHDAGFDHERFYIAMEFIKGESLRERLRREECSREEAVDLVTSLAEALDYAHRTSGGTLHRDVKPDNVMLDGSGQALLMDFGLARIEHSDTAGPSEGFMGTPGYMAPEQIKGEAEAASDQYSLGIVLYELLSRRIPFEGRAEALVLHTLNTSPPRLRELNGKIPADLDAICHKAIAFEAKDRYASCGEFAEDLKRFRERRETIARPLSKSQRLVRWCKRNRSLAAAIGMCGMLMIALMVMLSIGFISSERNASSLDEKNRMLLEKKEELSATNDTLQTSQNELSIEALESEIENAYARLRSGHDSCIDGQVPIGLARIAVSIDEFSQVRIRGDDLLRDLADIEQISRTNAAIEKSNKLEHAARASLSAWSLELHKLSAIHDHAGEVPRVLAVSEDGHFAATVTDGQPAKIRVWHAERGLLATSRISGQPVAVAFQPKAFPPFFATLTAVDSGSSLQFWQCTNEGMPNRAGDPIRTNHSSARIAFSGDGNFLFLAGNHPENGAEVMKYSTAKPEPIAIAGKEIKGAVTALAVSPRSDLIAIASSDGNSSDVVGWTIDGEQLWKKRISKGSIHELSFSHEGTLIAGAQGATLSGEARLWSAYSGLNAGKPMLHRHQVTSVSFSRDDRTILTASRDRTVAVWDRFSGERLGHLIQHDGEVWGARFWGDGSSVLSINNDGTARHWQLASGRPSKTVRVTGDIATAAALPAGGQVALVGIHNNRQGRTRLLDLTGEEVELIGQWDHPGRGAQLAATDSFGVVATADGILSEVDWNTGEVTSGGIGPRCTAVAVDQVSNGRFVLAGVDRGGVMLIDRLSGGKKPLPSQKANAPTSLVDFGPEKEPREFLSGCENSVVIWNLMAGRQLQKLPHRREVHFAKYDSTGDYLAIGFDGGGQVWQRSSAGKWSASLPTISVDSRITAIELWPERNLWATGHLDGTARLWHLATGEPVGPPLSHSGRVQTLFKGNHDHMIAVSLSGMIRQWPLPEATTADPRTLLEWAQRKCSLTLSDNEVAVGIGHDHFQRLTQQTLDIDLQLAEVDVARLAPIVARKRGESYADWVWNVESLRTSRQEGPRFNPPSGDYLREFVPPDTRAIVGVDVRQLQASPLLWQMFMSATVLSADVIRAIGFGDLVSGMQSQNFDQLLDVEYAVLAFPQNSLRINTLLGNSDPKESFQGTLIVRGRFDKPALEAMTEKWRQQDPKTVDIKHEPDRFMEIIVNGTMLYVALVDNANEGDMTILATTDRDHLMRVLNSEEIGEHPFLDEVEQARGLSQNSVWLFAKSEAIASDPIGLFLASQFESVEIGSIIFADMSVNSTFCFADEAAAARFDQLVETVEGIAGRVEHVGSRPLPEFARRDGYKPHSREMNAYIHADGLLNAADYLGRLREMALQTVRNGEEQAEQLSRQLNPLSLLGRLLGGSGDWEKSSREKNSRATESPSSTN